MEDSGLKFFFFFFLTIGLKFVCSSTVVGIYFYALLKYNDIVLLIMNSS